MMTWKREEISTIGSLVTALGKLEGPNEAQTFKTAYIESLRGMGVDDPEQVANDNLGYCTGYLGSDDLLRLQEWLDVQHPILGRGLVSPREAFAAGQDWMETGVPWRDRKKELQEFEEDLREG